jgi:CheY-specific phosphatase CheX
MATVPVQYMNPFFASVKRICGETIKIPVTAGPPSLHRGDDRLWKLYPVSAAIQLKNGVTGVIALSFSEPVALALASGLAQDFFSELSPDALDALGEVANLIIGSAKRDLPVGMVSISTPVILKTHELQIPTGVPHLLLPFEAGCGRFVMQMAIVAGASPAQIKPSSLHSQAEVDRLVKQAAA